MFVNTITGKNVKWTCKNLALIFNFMSVMIFVKKFYFYRKKNKKILALFIFLSIRQHYIMWFILGYIITVLICLSYFD